jgi:hypothetical protein
MKTKRILLFLMIFGFTAYQVIGQVTILSGPKQASYYQFVEDIAEVLNTDSETLVVNKETTGAAFNFNQLVDPKSPFKVALMQSDYLYYMQSFDFKNNTEKTKSLKVVLPLAHEEIHVVTKEGFNINRLQDLDSMTVAIGTKDQGTYATANLIKDRSEVYWKSRNVHYVDAMKELTMDRVHAFMIVGTAPLAKLNINPQAMNDQLVMVELNDFNDWAKYYDNDTIYAKDDKWLERDTPTFAVRTVLLINEKKMNDTDRQNVKKIMNGILNKYDVLKAQGHPKWKEVDFSAWSDGDWPMMK